MQLLAKKPEMYMFRFFRNRSLICFSIHSYLLKKNRLQACILFYMALGEQLDTYQMY